MFANAWHRTTETSASNVSCVSGGVGKPKPKNSASVTGFNARPKSSVSENWPKRNASSENVKNKNVKRSRSRSRRERHELRSRFGLSLQGGLFDLLPLREYQAQGG